MTNAEISITKIICLAGILGLLACPKVLAKEGLALSLSGYTDVKVEKVLAVNLILLENGEKIRLIGIKSEGRVKHKKVEVDEFGFVMEDANPEIPLAQKAFDYVQSLLEGQRVDVEFDVQKNDAQFRNLAYVFLTKDKTFVNAEILRRGYAMLHIQPPNIKYADVLRKAYQEARREKRGFQGE